MDGYERLGAELSLLIRATKELHTRVIQQAELPCETAAAMVLGRLAGLGPVRLTQLACELGLDTSSVSRHVSALERAGLVAKEKEEADQRAQRLVLTASGEAAVQRLRDTRATVLAELLPGWSTKQLDDLSTRLGRLNEDLAATMRDNPVATAVTAMETA